MAKLRRRNLSSLISDELLERVRSGKLRSGDRLPTEQGLMEEFGVGRNVIREAIQHLVALEVVDVRPRRGIVVTEHESASALDALAIGALLDDQTVEDLYSFRMLIETAIAERAAQRATPEDIARINESLEKFEASLKTHLGIFAADVDFHQQLANASGNIIYSRVLSGLADLLELYRRETDKVPGAPEQALMQHTVITKAIEAGDAAAARTAMKDHINTAIITVGEARKLPPQARSTAEVSAGGRQGF